MICEQCGCMIPIETSRCPNCGLSYNAEAISRRREEAKAEQQREEGRKPIRVIQIIYVISIMCMLCLLLTSCGSKKVYVVPAEVYFSCDLSNTKEAVIKSLTSSYAEGDKQLGYSKSMKYKDGNIWITATDEQTKKRKDDMITYLMGEDDASYMLDHFTSGNGITRVSDDYKELWYQADDKETWNSDKEYSVSKLLFLQILDGESYETAKVTVHVAFSDDTQSDFEYTCDNFYKDSAD